MDANTDFTRNQTLNKNAFDINHEELNYNNGVANLVKPIKSITFKTYEDSCEMFNLEENEFPSSNEVNMMSQNLTSIPTEIINLKHLKALYVSRNFIKSLPKNIRKLENLVFLDLSYNQLHCLPHTLSEIVQLRYLNISHNNFTVVPSALYEGLQFLRILNLCFNEIKHFEIPPLCINSIMSLNLSHNQMKNIPKWIFQADCKIENVDISYNSLTDVDIYFLSTNVLLKLVTNLQTLNLQNCSLISENLNFISNIKSLKTLRLNNHDVIKNKSRNFFKHLNMNVFENCSNLKILMLSDVGLPYLPPNFGDQVKFIEYLDLENNFLSWLPDSFCELYFLKVCRLSSNLIFCLPEKFGNLINLKEIYLNNNKFSEVPVSLKNLINLEYIDFYFNKLEYFDPNMINMTSLKGIDLEHNFINYLQLCGNEQKYEQFISKYTSLKEHYRQQILEERIDLQVTEDNDAEVVETYSTTSESGSEDISVNNDTRIRSSSDLENWDGDTANPLCFEDSEFDPNVNYEPDFKIKNKKTSIFSSNFCPADSHFPPVMKQFMRSSKTEDTIVEGQYDLD